MLEVYQLHHCYSIFFIQIYYSFSLWRNIFHNSRYMKLLFQPICLWGSRPNLSESHTDTPWGSWAWGNQFSSRRKGERLAPVRDVHLLGCNLPRHLTLGPRAEFGNKHVKLNKYATTPSCFDMRSAMAPVFSAATDVAVARGRLASYTDASRMALYVHSIDMCALIIKPYDEFMWHADGFMGVPAGRLWRGQLISRHIAHCLASSETWVHPRSFCGSTPRSLGLT